MERGHTESRAWRSRRHGPIGSLLGAPSRCAGLRRLARRRAETWRHLERQLERRRDLARLLVEALAVGGAAGGSAVVPVRAALAGLGGPLAPSERARREGVLAAALQSLLGELRARGGLDREARLRRLHRDLVEVDDHIQYLRRYHNGLARALAAAFSAAPDRCLVRLLGVSPPELFQPEARLEQQIARAYRRLQRGIRAPADRPRASSEQCDRS